MLPPLPQCIVRTGKISALYFVGLACKSFSVLKISDVITSLQHHSFHNFEHASHVTQSTSKLLKRIVLSDEAESLASAKVTAWELHTYSHGLASDCLSQFALVFCALIHDVDHPGVPNFQLVEEQTNIAKFYKNKR